MFGHMCTWIFALLSPFFSLALSLSAANFPRTDYDITYALPLPSSPPPPSPSPPTPPFVESCARLFVWLFIFRCVCVYELVQIVSRCIACFHFIYTKRATKLFFRLSSSPSPDVHRKIKTSRLHYVLDDAIEKLCFFRSLSLSLCFSSFCNGFFVCLWKFPLSRVLWHSLARHIKMRCTNQCTAIPSSTYSFFTHSLSLSSLIMFVFTTDSIFILFSVVIVLYHALNSLTVWRTSLGLLNDAFIYAHFKWIKYLLHHNLVPMTHSNAFCEQHELCNHSIRNWLVYATQHGIYTLCKQTIVFSLFCKIRHVECERRTRENEWFCTWSIQCELSRFVTEIDIFTARGV